MKEREKNTSSMSNFGKMPEKSGEQKYFIFKGPGCRTDKAYLYNELITLKNQLFN